ncbi:MAG TPA: cupin domain-containing protein [Bacteroidales bacterium]|nr:cupin domain-containing protein [Bacteroidales bacterium]
MESAFSPEQIYELKESIVYAEGSVVSKIVSKTNGGNVTLFAFDKDQFLSEHTAPFDAIVIVIDGRGKITINKKDYTLEENEMIIMPANIPHAVYGIDKFKMLLIMLKD